MLVTFHYRVRTLGFPSKKQNAVLSIAHRRAVSTKGNTKGENEQAGYSRKHPVRSSHWPAAYCKSRFFMGSVIEEHLHKALVTS